MSNNFDINIAKVSVIGAGAFGTSIANVIANKYLEKNITLWAYEKEVASEINTTHINNRYLSDVILPKNIKATSNLTQAVTDAQLILVIVPSNVLVDIVSKIAKHIAPSAHLAYLTKGLCKYKGSHVPSSKVLSKILVKQGERLVAISGPSHAEELKLSYNTSFMLGSTNKQSRDVFAELLTTSYVTCHGTDDILGVELGGALKNPVSIAAGIISVMPHCGDNITGVLIAEGFKEMIEIGTLLGAQKETFLELSGLGDLVATALSAHSRNRKFGQQIYEIMTKEYKSRIIIRHLKKLFGLYPSYEKQTHKLNYLAEGSYALKPVIKIANQNNLSIPIFRALYEVLSGNKDFSLLLETIKKPGQYKYLFQQAVSTDYVQLTQNSSIKRSNIVTQIIERSLLTFISENKKEKLLVYFNSIASSQRSRSEYDLITLLKESKFEVTLRKLALYYVQDIVHIYNTFWMNLCLKYIGAHNFFTGIFRRGLGRGFFWHNVKLDKNSTTIIEKHKNSKLLYFAELQNPADILYYIYVLKRSGLPHPIVFCSKGIQASRFLKFFFRVCGISLIDEKKYTDPLYVELLTQYILLLAEQKIPILMFKNNDVFEENEQYDEYKIFLADLIESAIHIHKDMLLIPITLFYYKKPDITDFSQKLTLKVLKNKATVFFSTPISYTSLYNKKDIIQSITKEIDTLWATSKTVYPHYLLCRIVKNNNYSLATRDLKKKVNEFLQHNNIEDQFSYKEVIKKGIRFIKKYNLGHIEQDILLITNKNELDYYAGKIV